MPATFRHFAINADDVPKGGSAALPDGHEAGVKSVASERSSTGAATSVRVG